MNTVKFNLPLRGTLAPNNAVDPLKYYYMPLIGRLFVSRIQIVLDLLKNNRRCNNSLEIGYGSGILMPTLCRISDKVFGVDTSSDPELVTELLGRLGYYPHLSRGIPSKILFEDNTFDLVVAISVLEHVQDIKPFLVEIYRVLKPGGLLLVGMPAVNKNYGILVSTDRLFWYRRSSCDYSGGHARSCRIYFPCQRSVAVTQFFSQQNLFVQSIPA